MQVHVETRDYGKKRDDWEWTNRNRRQRRTKRVRAVLGNKESGISQSLALKQMLHHWLGASFG
jgi:hypothetical protein